MHIDEREEQRRRKRSAMLVVLVIAVAGATIAFLVSGSTLVAFIALVALLALLIGASIARAKLRALARVRKIESAFPDFIEFMASNLRAGMTVDRALFLSARREFAPLDQEIIHVGKDVVTGKEMTLALRDMAKHINSEKITKTVDVIISGIVSGGNLAVLLEETAIAMRERTFIEKKAAANVLMYVILIFAAAGVGAPILFALSTVLVSILASVLGTLPPAEALGSLRIPLTFSRITISPDFVHYFALAFLTITDILACLVIGLVNKGNEREGMKYIPVLLALSISLFFIIKAIFTSYLTGFFS